MDISEAASRITQSVDSIAPGNPLGVFADYVNLGVIVVFFALFLAGKIRREYEVKERDERIKKLEESIAEYIEHYQKEVLPALIDATKVSGEIVSYLNKRRT